MTSPIYSFDGVTGGYGGGIVVNDVSGCVEQGQVLSFWEGMALGKARFSICFWLSAINSGSVRFKQMDLVGKKPEEMSSLGITFCPQERVVFGELSVLENLILMRGYRDITHLEEYFEHFPILAERLSQDAGTLSEG